MLQYTKIPRSIYQDSNIPLNAKMLLMLMKDRSDFFGGKVFFCKQEWIAEKMDLSVRAVKSIISTLSKAGYIKIFRKGNYNHYALNIEDTSSYVPVSRNIYMNNTLTYAERITLIALIDSERFHRYAGNDEGRGFSCKITYLAERLDLSVRNIKECIKGLKDKGMIDITKSGTYNTYEIKWDIIDNKEETMEEKVEDKKIIDNQESTLSEAARQFLKNSSIQRVDPDDDDFPAFVLQEISKERMGLWLYLSKKRMGKHLLNEINKYVAELSARHYGGEYQQSIREICLRRVRNAS